MKIREIGKFISAGNAVFSITNTKQNTKYMFKVKKHKNFDIGTRTWSVHVKLRAEGEEGYGYLGMIKNSQFCHTMYSMFNQEHSMFSDFEWFFLQVIRGVELPRHIIFEHMGRCGKCARLLVDPISVERGIGPICRQAV